MARIFNSSLILRAFPTNSEKPTSDAILCFATKDAPRSEKRAVLVNCCSWSKENPSDKYWKAKFNDDLPPLISFEDTEGKLHLHSYTLVIDDCDSGWKVSDIQFANGTSVFHRFDVVDKLFAKLGGDQ